jgi:hypothetical protein
MLVALELFEHLEIEYIPSSEAGRRGPRQTHCGNVVNRMILKHGLPHATIVLRTIVESSEGNAVELIADTIGAISDIVRAHPRWVGLGMQWLEAFDNIDLAQVRKTAKAANLQHLKIGISTLLCIDLEKILGPSKLPKPPKPVRVKPEPKPPRSLTRIPEIERNIALGVDLLALRTAIPGNAPFGREVRRRFPDVERHDASAAMRAARMYSSKPEIYRAASWRTLVELSRPKWRRRCGRRSRTGYWPARPSPPRRSAKPAAASKVAAPSAQSNRRRREWRHERRQRTSRNCFAISAAIRRK